MKKLLYTLIPALISFAACKKDDSLSGPVTDPGALGAPGALITIDTLSKAYKANRSKDLILNDYKITGTVISDGASGNTPAGNVIIESGNKGITLYMSAADAAGYALGDSLVVAIKGDTLTNRLGTLVLSTVSAASIQTVATGKTVAPLVLTLNELNVNFAKYEATLVKLVNATINPAPDASAVFAGDHFLSDVTGQSTVFLHTESSSVFGNDALPPMGTFICIPHYYNAVDENTNVWASKQLLIRNRADIKAVKIIAAWQFGSPASAGNELQYKATTTDPGLIDTSFLRRGNGFNTASLARGFSSSAKLVDKSIDDAIATNSYYQFTVTGAPGHTMSLNSANVRLRRSAAGASVTHWYYSLDGVNFKAASGADMPLTSTDDLGVEQPPTDFSETPELQLIPAGTVVTLRLYAWGFSNVNSGTFAIARYGSGITTPCLSLTGIVD